MFDDLLDVETVRALLTEKGVKVNWLITYLGLSRSTGYVMFRNGLLPKDISRRKDILKKLSNYLGTPATQLLVRPHRPRKSA